MQPVRREARIERLADWWLQDREAHRVPQCLRRRAWAKTVGEIGWEHQNMLVHSRYPEQPSGQWRGRFVGLAWNLPPILHSHGPKPGVYWTLGLF